MNELSDQVKKWVNEQGYPIEMFVAKKFRELGFRTTQSEYYDDPESGDNREIDIVASKQVLIGELLVRIRVCVECKSSKKHPWVVFTSQDTRIAKPAAIVQRPASKLGKLFLHSIAHESDAQALSLFRLDKRNGYGLTEAFTSGKDNAYASCISVAKCAKSITDDETKGSYQQGPICAITIPLVLIEGKLFECHQDDLELEVSEIARSQLIWRNQTSNIGHSIINIVTKGALEDFIADVQEFIDFSFRQETVFKEIEENALGDHPNRWKSSLITRQSSAD
ncbi:hypothetical protein ACK305_02845 [Aeromonas caviae]